VISVWAAEEARYDLYVYLSTHVPDHAQAIADLVTAHLGSMDARADLADIVAGYVPDHALATVVEQLCYAGVVTRAQHDAAVTRETTWGQHLGVQLEAAERRASAALWAVNRSSLARARTAVAVAVEARSKLPTSSPGWRLADRIIQIFDSAQTLELIDGELYGVREPK